MKKFAIALAAVLATAGIAAADDFASQLQFPTAQAAAQQNLDYSSTGSIKQQAPKQDDESTQPDRD